MKTLRTLFVFNLLFAAVAVFAQQKTDCVDIVRLRDGSEFRGRITAHTPGEGLTIVTWSGLTLQVAASSIKHIKQRCKDTGLSKPYDFKERGLYNATRFATLVGDDYFGQNSKGFSLSHSTGWMFNRWLGVGIGAGVETYDPETSDIATYPIFAELRGYFFAKNVSPFYVVSGGWAFAGKNSNDNSNYIETSKGGWLAKAQLGYRFGNHFTLHCGLSLQKNTVDWQSFFWNGERGRDRILHKRLELGVGVLL